MIGELSAYLVIFLNRWVAGIIWYEKSSELFQGVYGVMLVLQVI